MRENTIANASLVSVVATVILANITHAYDFGHRAYIAGLVLILLLGVVNMVSRSRRSRVALVVYGLLNAWVILGFGLFNGFWNHTAKVFLVYLHNGYMPPLFAGLFLTPKTGSVFYESVGVLTFITSLPAAYFGFQFLRGER